MILSDLEFLRGASTGADLLVYRYRSGSMRHQVERKLKITAEANERVFCAVEPDELIARWGVPGLFDTSLVCAVRTEDTVVMRNSLRALADCLHYPPAGPTAVFVPAHVEVFAEPAIVGLPGVAVIEERIIDNDNVTSHLQYLCEVTDLSIPEGLPNDQAFVTHFMDRVDDGEINAIDDLAAEFDRTVLLCVDRFTGKYVAENTDEAASTERSAVVRALRRMVVSQEIGNAGELIHALALKKERGWSRNELVAEVCRATTKLLCVGAEKASSKHPDTLLIWATLLCLWSDASDPNVVHDAEGGGFLVAVDRLTRALALCSSKGSDPLSGYWAQLRQLAVRWPSSIDEGSVSAPVRLLDAVRRQIVRGQTAWLDRLWRVLNEPQEQGGSARFWQSEATSCGFVPLNDLIGQSVAVEMIRTRFARSSHSVPLLITGPDGMGKLTLARGYAKALLCETENRSIQPCGACEACQSFELGSFGYLEFDLERLRRIDAAQMQSLGSEARRLVRGLQERPFSRHRVFVIKNAEAETRSLDVFLKSFENGNSENTFILLARDAKSVRAAALSRCWDVRLTRLQDADARSLVARWAGSKTLDGDLLSLVVSYAGGIPGRLRDAYEIVFGLANLSFFEAKRALGFGWGQEAICFWLGMFSSGGAQPSCSDLFVGVSAAEKIGRLREVLAVIRPGAIAGAPNSSAFLGLNAELVELADRLASCAAQACVSEAELWDALAREWTKDCYFDNEGLVEIVTVMRGLSSGSLMING